MSQDFVGFQFKVNYLTKKTPQQKGIPRIAPGFSKCWWSKFALDTIPQFRPLIFEFWVILKE